MFDFEKLIVYSKAKEFNADVRKYLSTNKFDKITNDQLRRASFSIVLNIAEGSGRFSNADRKNFFIISRSSIFECIAIFDVLRDENNMDDMIFENLYSKAEELSKILFRLIQNLTK